ncbi:MAG TPA: hypothetical protein VGF82_16720 [Terracidiphilus sp.]|jgi:hypothetical protein
MKLDLRIPMGLIFTFTGVILATWGIKTNDNSALYIRSLGINVNLWWGLVLILFGVTIYILGQRSRRIPDEQSLSHPGKETKRRKR